MISSSAQRVVALSVRLYRLLLHCYPAAFHQHYHAEMAQTFRDCCRASLYRNGYRGLVSLWGFTLYDLSTTAFMEHLRECLVHLRRLMGLMDSNEEMEHIIMAKQFLLNIAERTDIGRKRATNEDSLLSVIPENEQTLTTKGVLFVVADGMGGYEAGEVASRLAVETIRATYYRDTNEDVTASLLNAMRQANSAVYQEAAAKLLPEDKSMGTTCVAAVLQGNTLYVANVGDSRAYIVRNGQLKQISHDHSSVYEQLQQGLLTEEQARTHPERNQISRALGIKPDVEIDIFSEQVENADVLLLCTDGLTAMITNEELRSIVNSSQPSESVRHLIERANEQGGEDNITAIVAQVSFAS